VAAKRERKRERKREEERKVEHVYVSSASFRTL
jgi:hypothetical protein